MFFPFNLQITCKNFHYHTSKNLVSAFFYQLIQLLAQVKVFFLVNDRLDYFSQLLINISSFFIRKLHQYRQIFKIAQNNILQKDHLMEYFNSAFKPLVSEPRKKLFEESLISNRQNCSIVRQLPNIRFENEIFYNGDVWQNGEIERLFKLYDQYGSQWKILAQKMTPRTANNLKNRFYTVLRNLIKLLFRKMIDSCPKLPGQIPSKDLSRLYDGKQEYQPFKFLISTILKKIDYDLQNPKIKNIIDNFSEEIVQIYLTIYGQRARIAIDQEKRRKKSEQNANSTVLIYDQEKNFKQVVNNGVQQGVQNLKRTNFNIEPSQEGMYLYFYFYNPVNYCIPNQM